MSEPPKQGREERGGSRRVRVPTHLEEAPAFILSTVSGRMVNIPRVEWNQAGAGRQWVIRGDSEFGMAGALAQRIWLALMALYDEQRHAVPGVVFFTLRGLLERAHIARGADANDRARQALVQIDALRIYITGAPLPGPTTPTVGLGASTYLYSFTGGERVDVPDEEVLRHQITLPGLEPPLRFRRHSSIRLSPYVTESLSGHAGRTVEEWVLELRSPWAVRLARLIGKRAYDKSHYAIRLETLAPALPALDTMGNPMRPAALVRQLDAAHAQLYRHGFITDALLDERGLLTYQMGGRAQPRRPLSDFEQEVVAELVGIFREERRREQAEEIVADLGADRARACIRDWRDLHADQGPIDRQLRRLSGLISAARQQRGHDRAQRQPLRASRRE